MKATYFICRFDATLTLSRVEEAVSHWSDKSFYVAYVAWTTLNVWKATAIGAQL